MHQFTVSFIRVHLTTYVGACVFSCNLPAALLQNDRDLLRITAVTRRWNRYRNQIPAREESAQKVDLAKNVFPPLLQGFEPESLKQ